MQHSSLHDIHKLRIKSKPYQEALAYIDKLESATPESKGFELLRGSVHQSYGEINKAISCYERELKQNPRCFLSHSNLGVILFDQGKIPEAIASLKLAMLTGLNHPLPYFNLGNAMRSIGRLQEACIYYQQSLKLNPEHVDTWINLAPILRQLARPEEAQKAYKIILKLDPSNSTAKHFLAAFEQTPSKRAPADYVRRLFNDYAKRFDQHINEDLQYRIPEMVQSVIEQTQGSFKAMSVCDLGCGTGIMAATLATPKQIWTGVDLSKEMLGKAKQKKLYHSLIENDLNDFLINNRLSYDCILAADTLPYLGDLQEFFENAAKRLNRAGHLILSSEDSDATASYQLTRTGRFQHYPPYLISLAKKHSLKLITMEQNIIRKNRDQPVKGTVYLFQKEER